MRHTGHFLTYIVWRHRENAPALPHVSLSLSLVAASHAHLENTNIQIIWVLFVILLEQDAMKSAYSEISGLS